MGYMMAGGRLARGANITLAQEYELTGTKSGNGPDAVGDAYETGDASTLRLTFTLDEVTGTDTPSVTLKVGTNVDGASEDHLVAGVDGWYDTAAASPGTVTLTEASPTARMVVCGLDRFVRVLCPERTGTDPTFSVSVTAEAV